MRNLSRQSFPAAGGAGLARASRIKSFPATGLADATGRKLWERPTGSRGGWALPNGNMVFTSYGAKDDQVKLFEVTPEKKVAWTYRDGEPFGIHTFQLLAEGGKPLPGRAWK